MQGNLVTGMRLCISAVSSFGSVVMIEKVCSQPLLLDRVSLVQLLMSSRIGTNVKDVIFFGNRRNGPNRIDDQEIGMLCLHLI